MVGILIAGAAALAVMTAILAWRFSRPGSAVYMADIPNNRSLHSRPISRSGGVAISAALAVAAALWLFLGAPAEAARWVIGSAFVLALISFWEDRAGIRRLYRLLGHTAVVSAMVGGGGLWLAALPLPGSSWPLPPSLGILLAIVCAVWMVNLYNFMDGMDGLAGGMALVGFGSYAVFGWLHGAIDYAGANLMIVAAAAGFLILNRPPARIFMGDLGSTLLGFLAAANALWGIALGLFSPMAPLLLFSPFIADATATLLRRVARGERFWEPHRSHYYQRLVQVGWGHRDTLKAEICLMLVCGLLAQGYERATTTVQWTLLAVWLALLVAAARTVVHLEHRHALQKTIQPHDRGA